MKDQSNQPITVTVNVEGDTPAHIVLNVNNAKANHVIVKSERHTKDKNLHPHAAYYDRIVKKLVLQNKSSEPVLFNRPMKAGMVLICTASESLLYASNETFIVGYDANGKLVPIGAEGPVNPAEMDKLKFDLLAQLNEPVHPGCMVKGMLLKCVEAHGSLYTVGRIYTVDRVGDSQPRPVTHHGSIVNDLSHYTFVLSGLVCQK